MTEKRRFTPVLAALALAFAAVAMTLPQRAEAVLLDFEFDGFAAGGSSLDLGSGPVDISGAGFTAVGMTTSDTDVVPELSVGGFGAMASFDFGGAGIFHTDGVTDIIYFQACEDAASISCVGLTTAATDAGVVGHFTDIVPGDKNAGGIVIGTKAAIATTFFKPFVLTNAAGHVLTLVSDASSLVSMTATAKPPTSSPAPEPGMLGLLGLGLLGAGLARRRRG